MTHTSVVTDPSRLGKQLAVRYGRHGQPLPFYYTDHPGASALFSSAYDLALFCMFHLKAHLPDQKRSFPTKPLMSSSPTFVLKNVEDFSVFQSRPVPDTRLERVEQKKL